MPTYERDVWPWFSIVKSRENQSWTNGLCLIHWEFEGKYELNKIEMSNKRK